ncbi:hypothetical protein DFQ28_002763 [Apophysomyces sp. BC1034]|nr:hypothetical protein DFQ29_003372 [Apophysomyces sp. BC1021]KAG0193888.1 hypothetical protein DFQ28_002763 [Apophysomyces sp. BC1034]
MSSTPSRSASCYFGDDESQPLLSPTTTYISIDDDNGKNATGTVMSSSMNMANNILGTGMLTMPAAVASVGLIPGLGLILLSGFTSILGLYFLTECATFVRGQSSFFAVSQITWPKVSSYFDVVIVIKCFGVAVGYLLIVGDLMPQIFTVFNELQDNTPRRVLKVLVSSVGGSAVMYQIIGVMGYLSFGKDVRGNVILEYPPTLYIAFGRLSVVILAACSYPMVVHPCRDSLCRFLDTDRHILSTIAIIICTYLTSIALKELDLVLAFVGSTGSTTISFILPGLFYYKLHEYEPWNLKKRTAVGLAVYGFLVMGVCLTFNVKRLLEQ